MVKELKKMKVMVDDEEDIQSLFKQKFRKKSKQGKLNSCFSCQQRQLWTRKKPGSVYCLDFIDINMPGMNGLELLRILKEKFPKFQSFFYDYCLWAEGTYKTAIAFCVEPMTILLSLQFFDTLKLNDHNLE